MVLDPNSIDDYRLFLKIKSLPRFKFTGREAWFPDEYAAMLEISTEKPKKVLAYKPLKGLFDYQRDIAALAIRKKKFCVFAECGLGKSLILLEYALHVQRIVGPNRRVLITSPLMVVRQTIEECVKFYGADYPIEKVPANRLKEWLKGDGSGKIGITNYEALTDDLEPGALAALINDESSCFKSAYGKWGQICIRLGKGLEWKLCLTGTPAPNDRIEFANHAVIMDYCPTVNSFLARFFINRGQTDNRWELKKHAIGPFYRALSHWSIFLTNPATYGWKDNCETIPPIHVHIHDVDLTTGQREAVFDQTGTLFVDSVGGITQRSKLSQIGKGNHNGVDVATLKPAYIKSLVDSWPDESTIIWCHYNHEQKMMEQVFPNAASIKGETPMEERERLVWDFKSGKNKVMLSKAKVLGWGLNLQVCTRMIFSGLQDSYEMYHQAIKRANRIGSTRPLHVHLPLTEIERPMVETVLRKARRVESDSEEQERTFKENMYAF